MLEFCSDVADFIDFRDQEVLSRVRSISREKFTEHGNSAFQIKVYDTHDSLYDAFAQDIVTSLETALDEDRDPVLIVPAGPMGQYHRAAKMINARGLSLSRAHFFAMDEYANADGESAPESWRGSFRRALMQSFFDRIDSGLRPPLESLHFPAGDTITSYGKTIHEMGGADVCFGGIGWNGHIAFWEPHLGREFRDDLEGYCNASSRLVGLHPTTILQNALHSFGGDWSAVPPKAVTIGPAEILGARRRSFWLDGDLGGGISWQRFIARLVAHGPVSQLVPGSILQTAPTTFNVVGGVADAIDVEIH